MLSLHALSILILVTKPSKPVPMQMPEEQQDVGYISVIVWKVIYKDVIFMI